MKRIQTISINWKAPVSAILALWMFAGCSVDALETSNDSLTAEELEISSQILGESLSDQNEGIFSSLNDAFLVPVVNSTSPASAGNQKQVSLFKGVAAGDETENSPETTDDYTYQYDPESGTHTISYDKSIQNQQLQKESSVLLNYIYYDQNGSLIEAPELDQDRIETIDYSSDRTGLISNTNKTSTYERKDQFLIDGLASGNGTIQIDGTHTGSGTFEMTNRNGQLVQRSYTLTVDFLNVIVHNEAVDLNKSLQKGAAGTLVYEMVIRRSVNGSEDTKTVNGTIEFTGDGTANLNFRDAFENIRVKIEDGDVFEEDEYEGFVQSVNLEDRTFTLSNGEQFLISPETVIEEESDLSTLEEVQRVLDREIRVKAEVTVSGRSEDFFTTLTASFEYEEEDLEFKGEVEGVDLAESTITLTNGRTLQLDADSTEIEDGDLGSLEEVETALSQGATVKAEGEYILTDEETYLVVKIEFEIKREQKEQEFEGYVNSVHRSMNSFEMTNGRTVQVTGQTEIDGELNSLQEVHDALERGRRVEVEGKYRADSNGRIVATELEFDLVDDEEGFEEVDFEGIVQSVDLPEKSFTLTNGLTLFITNSTEIEDEDYRTLQQVHGAIRSGASVEAEGEFFTNNDGRNIVIEVEFERRDEEDDDSDDDGDDEEFEEEDFEGIVQSVDLPEKSFTLTNGLTLFITNSTEIEDEDYRTLQQVHGAIQSGVTVEAEGEYYTTDDGQNIVIEVEFERRDEEDDDEEFEEEDFEGIVASVDIPNSSFTLSNGRTLYITDSSEIDGGDYRNLRQVHNAVRRGITVEAEGEYFTRDDGRNIVIEVEFERRDEDGDDDDDNDGEDGDDDDDEEFEEEDFEGIVQSVNQSDNSFTLTNGLTLFITNSTEIEDEDYRTLQEVQNAIQSGVTVEAEGEYYTNDDGQNIVIEVEFERRDEDDDENDDDDEDDDDED